jgi:hypothetical protein
MVEPFEANGAMATPRWTVSMSQPAILLLRERPQPLYVIVLDRIAMSSRAAARAPAALPRSWIPVHESVAGG